MTKKSTLLIPFLFSCLSFSFGQGIIFERGLNDEINQSVVGVINKDQFSYVLTNTPTAQANLSKFDSLGNEVFNVNPNQFSNASIFSPSKFVMTNDGNIWITGYSLIECDLLQYTQFVVVLDGNGNYVNHFTKSQNGVITTPAYKALSAIDDSTVATTFSNDDSTWIEIFTPHIQTILPNSVPPLLFSFTQNSNFHLLGHTLTKLYGISNQGVLQDSIAFPLFIRDIATWNDTIYAIGNNVIHKITPNIQTFTTQNFPSISAFSNLKLNAQGIRFASSGFYKKIVHLDYNLQTQYIDQIQTFINGSFAFDYDKHFTYSRDYYLTDLASVRLAGYSLTTAQNTPINNSDIAVISTQVTDSDVQLIDPSANNYKTKVRMNVLIKNEGPNIVDSVKLNYYAGQSFYCANLSKSEYYSNLSLAVGDSVWIDFGWIGESSQGHFNVTVNRDFCIYSSNPNGIVDLNIPNDEYCANHIFGFIGLEENKKLDFNLYPNPTANFVKIDVENGFDGKYIIIDNAGRLVQSESVDTSDINLSNLNSGVYFITLIDTKGNSSLPKKLIKQ